MDYIPQLGDIILEDSNKVGPRIVKFFMTAPTVYHHIYRAITRKQEIVDYYHVAMILNETEEIEQQSKVQISEWKKDHKQIIFRRIDLTLEEQQLLKKEALKDIGQGYDVLNCIGKFLTWLTGIKFFARYVEYPKAEICINRVSHWYKNALKEKFGAVTHSELTTQTIYTYLIQDIKYKIVYMKS
jgi:hypothetical protein